MIQNSSSVWLICFVNAYYYTKGDYCYRLNNNSCFVDHITTTYFASVPHATQKPRDDIQVMSDTAYSNGSQRVILYDNIVAWKKYSQLDCVNQISEFTVGNLGRLYDYQGYILLTKNCSIGPNQSKRTCCPNYLCDQYLKGYDCSPHPCTCYDRDCASNDPNDPYGLNPPQKDCLSTIYYYIPFIIITPLVFLWSKMKNENQDKSEIHIGYISTIMIMMHVISFVLDLLTLVTIQIGYAIYGYTAILVLVSRLINTNGGSKAQQDILGRIKMASIILFEIKIINIMIIQDIYNHGLCSSYTNPNLIVILSSSGSSLFINIYKYLNIY